MPVTLHKMSLEVIEQDGWLKVSYESRPLTCPVCGGQHYWERSSVMNTAASEFFGFAWADKRATNFICARCGYIFWFLAKDVKRSIASPRE
jgi:hypothetical protein